MSKIRPTQPPTPPTETDLPEGWASAMLKQLGADMPYPIGDGDHGQIKPSCYQAEGIPYIRVADIGWGELQPSGMVYIPEDVHVANLKSELRPGDVVIAKTGATIGKCAIIPPDMPRANTTSSVGKVTVDKRLLLPEWLLYYFLTEQFRSDMWAVSEKTAQPGFSNRSLETFVIPLAPLPEQKRIVAKLEALLARTNAARSWLAKATPILKRFRQSVLAAACSGQLTAEWRGRRTPDADCDDLPSGWRNAPVSRLASKEPRSIQSGPFGSNLLHSEFQKTGVLAIGIDNVLHGAFSLGREHRISPEKFAELAKYRARSGDVLITVMATIGRVCVVPDNLEPAIITKHVYRITPDRTQVEPRYLMFSLMGDPVLTASMAEQVRGQTRPGINGEILKGLQVRVPPLEEQREIVRRVEALFALADRIEGHVRAATERAERMPQAILARAFRGELVPTEAELAAKEGRAYEPAAVLLERIQETRKKHEPAPQERGRGGKSMAKRSTGRQPAKKRRALVDVLREQGKPLTPERLFDLAGFGEDSVDGFYEELRKLIQDGKVRENRPNKKDVTLEAVGT